ncbi:hypothetical protein KIPB_008154 [Kipferlia bialata]|uniref:Uncharacterized protein n=1 Tax=Kipferlia bialata TaxID=797122 RepID=A0A9K3GKK3_9EUKA|nr:hypothetical protein KIPB_008154 [Kipferlia bialata]|eukprot:g8154.t1
MGVDHTATLIFGWTLPEGAAERWAEEKGVDLREISSVYPERNVWEDVFGSEERQEAEARRHEEWRREYSPVKDRVPAHPHLLHGVSLTQTGNYYVDEGRAWHVSLFVKADFNITDRVPLDTLQTVVTDTDLIARGRALAVEMGARDAPPTLYACGSVS